MLATLAVIYSLYVRHAALGFGAHDERLQAQSLEASAVELAVYRLTANPRLRPAAGAFNFRQGSAAVHVAFRSENSLIDLNFAPRRLLAGLFTVLGEEPEVALQCADRILGWRSSLNGGMPDSEASLYQAAGKAYGPRHGLFQHVEELAMVAGIPQVLLDRALPFLTVYGGRPEVNIMGAPRQVLAALPGMSPGVLQQVLAARETSPKDVLKARLGLAGNYVTTDAGAANRISAEVLFQTGHHLGAHAVVFLLDKQSEPYRVMSWSDDDEQPK